MNLGEELPDSHNITWGEELVANTEISPTATESWNWIVALMIIIAFIVFSGIGVLLRKLHRQYVIKRRARRDAEEASKRVAQGLQGVPPDFDLSVSHVTI
ncbi:hypothetical protein ANCCAN_08991 [Ancylostoma caninum]|uniref:Uncharacterized protein n=1 Tax=Ancylostoma caninum TaxID=29170 RepID=A0A368GKV9_ANCCA|nr:hypothetical protein ANCCAN_08991 [Ancylostoma caninum]